MNDCEDVLKLPKTGETWRWKKKKNYKDYLTLYFALLASYPNIVDEVFQLHTQRAM